MSKIIEIKKKPAAPAGDQPAPAAQEPAAEDGNPAVL